MPVISIKPDIGELLSGALDEPLRAFAALVPAGAMVTCWHEGETAGNGLSAGQVLALHDRSRRIFKAASPHCRYGQIVSCYTATRASGHYPLGVEGLTAGPAGPGACRCLASARSARPVRRCTVQSSIAVAPSEP